MPGRRFISNSALAILIGAGVLSGLSCNSMRVYVSDSVPPDFTFNAGRFAECCTDFATFQIFEEGSPKPLWKIDAQRTRVERSEANSLLIHYGKTPERFAQAIPATGPPPPLVEGKIYLAVAGGTSYVPWANVKFSIAQGKIVRFPAERGSQP